MVKCKSCGKEISLGRKLFHECENNCMFFGKILKDKTAPEKNWNCLSNFNSKTQSVPKTSCSLEGVKTKKQTIRTSAIK